MAPSTVDVIENSNITLTCSLNGDVSAWRLSSGAWSYIVIANDSACQIAGFISNKTLYSWYCHGNGSFSLTLIKVNRRQHGDKWICRQGFNSYSNDVVINVKGECIKIFIYINCNIWYIHRFH